MDLIWLVLGLAIVGYVLYLIETSGKIDPTFMWLIRIVIILAVILYLLRTFGKFIPNIMS